MSRPEAAIGAHNSERKAHRFEEHVGEIEAGAGALELLVPRRRLAIESFALPHGEEVLLAEPLPVGAGDRGREREDRLSVPLVGRGGGNPPVGSV